MTDTETEHHIETLRLALEIIARGYWNVGRAEFISVNEYARQALMAAGLWDDDAS